MGFLALEANQLVPREKLLELLWGERPPLKARAVVQTRISEIRTVLRSAAPEDLSTHLQTAGNTGYLLRIPAESVDVQVFRTTTERARKVASDEEASALLRGALDLWRGPALGGCTQEDPFAVVCQGLDAARLTATEDLFDVELRLGNHNQIVDQIAELSALHPTRERLIGQLMVALYRAGRNAESLHSYDRWRRWLADELGVDPGADLQALHLAVLQGNLDGAGILSAHPRDEKGSGPAPSARRHSVSAPDADSMNQFAAKIPRTLPPDIADFSGRTQELESLRTVLIGSEDGIAAASVTGQGGVGKTALSIHLAHQLSGDFPDGQLYINLRGADQSTSVEPFVALGRFLLSLGVDDLPHTLEERQDLYRGLLAKRRVLVVLDNAATEAQVIPLIPSGRNCAVIINGRARLGATFGARPIDVDVLRPSDADQLLCRMAGVQRVQNEAASAQELARLCGFLPLALRIVAAKLVTKPHWNIAKIVRLLEDERSRLNHLRHEHLDVRATISLSFAGLDADGQRLLRRIGDINLPEIGVGLAASLLDVNVSVAEQVLEHLFDNQLVEVAGEDSAGYARYRLHDLVKLFAQEQASVDESPSELEAARSRAFAFYLEVAAVAYRAIFGGDYLTIHGPALRPASQGRHVEELASDPVRWFETERTAIVAVVERAAETGQVDCCWDLMCTVSPLFPMRRYFDEWRSIAERALAAVQEAGNRKGEAAVRYRMGMLCADRREHEKAMEHFEVATRLFHEEGERHGHAITTAHLGMVDRFLGKMDSALENYESAIPGLRAAGDAAGEAFVLRSIGQVHLERGEYSAADINMDKALRLCQSLDGFRMAEAQVTFWQGMLRLKQRRLDEAECNFEQVLALMQVLGDPRGQAQALRGLGMCYHQQGHREKAKGALTEAMELIRQPRPGLMESYIRRALEEVDAAR